jgi:putative SOS response-associated peptidase YedK
VFHCRSGDIIFFIEVSAIGRLPKWLGEEAATEQELLRPCLDEWLKIWRVDNKVGNVRNAGPELILPLEEPLL